MTEIRDIHTNGAIRLTIIYEFSFLQQYEEHAIAHIRGLLSEDQELKDINEEHIVQIYGNKNHILFEGVIQKISIFERGVSHKEIEIALISKSICYDQEKRTRSFQNVSMTYKQLTKNICENVMWHSEKRNTIGKPLIQYYETDWEFTKRITSHVHEKIYPTIGAQSYSIGVGYDAKIEAIDVNVLKYKLKYSADHLEKEQSDQRDYLFYEIESTEDVELGSKIKFKNKEGIIFEKKGKLHNGVLIFIYKVGGKVFIQKPYQFNQNFIGRTILGSVLSTKNETVRVKLEIDKTQMESEAYDYSYEPETGNIMYAMPMKGTKVSLYFGDCDERTGRVINCIRTNSGESCSAMQNSDNKIFTTEFQKQMVLGKKQIVFAENGNSDQSPMLKLDDETGICIYSNKKISLFANELIKAQGLNLGLCGKAKVEIGQEYSFVGEPDVSVTISDFNIDILAQDAEAQLTKCYIYPEICDAPEVVHCQDTWKKVLTGILVAVAVAVVVAAVVAAVVTCPAVVAAVPMLAAEAVTFGSVFSAGVVAGSLAGSVAVGVKAYEDEKNDTSGSYLDYMKIAAANSGPAAFTGAISFAGIEALEIFNLSSKQKLFAAGSYLLGDTNLSYMGTQFFMGDSIDPSTMVINSALALITFGLTEKLPIKGLNEGVHGQVRKWLDHAVDWLGEEADESRFVQELYLLAMTEGDNNLHKELLEYLEKNCSSFQGRIAPEFYDKFLFNGLIPIEFSNRYGVFSMLGNLIGGSFLSSMLNSGGDSASEEIPTDEEIIEEHNESVQDRKKQQVKEYVTRGAIMKCTCGSHARILDMQRDNGFRFISTDEYPHPFTGAFQCEFGEKKNIKSFGLCSSKTNPSDKQVTLVVPQENGGTKNVTGILCEACLLGEQWFDTETNTLLPGTGELVTQKSFHACKYGGFIEFYTSGEEYHGQKENGKIIKE